MTADENSAKSPSTRAGRFAALVRSPDSRGSGALLSRRIGAFVLVVALAVGLVFALSAGAATRTEEPLLSHVGAFAAKPCGTTTDTVGDLYVAEAGSSPKVKIYGPSGTSLTEFGDE